MSLQKEIESFQRDLEEIEIDLRKHCKESRLQKWLERRKKRRHKGNA